MTTTKTDTDRDPDVSQKAPEGPRDSEEPPERAQTTPADESVEKRGPEAGEVGKKKEGKKKDEGRGTEKDNAGKPASKDAA